MSSIPAPVIGWANPIGVCSLALGIASQIKGAANQAAIMQQFQKLDAMVQAIEGQLTTLQAEVEWAELLSTYATQVSQIDSYYTDIAPIVISSGTDGLDLKSLQADLPQSTLSQAMVLIDDGITGHGKSVTGIAAWLEAYIEHMWGTTSSSSRCTSVCEMAHNYWLKLLALQVKGVFLWWVLEYDMNDNIMQTFMKNFDDPASKYYAQGKICQGIATNYFNNRRTDFIGIGPLGFEGSYTLVSDHGDSNDAVRRFGNGWVMAQAGGVIVDWQLTTPPEYPRQLELKVFSYPLNSDGTLNTKADDADTGYYESTGHDFSNDTWGLIFGAEPESETLKGTYPFWSTSNLEVPAGYILIGLKAAPTSPFSSGRLYSYGSGASPRDDDAFGVYLCAKFARLKNDNGTYSIDYTDEKVSGGFDQGQSIDGFDQHYIQLYPLGSKGARNQSPLTSVHFGQTGNRITSCAEAAYNLNNFGVAS